MTMATATTRNHSAASAPTPLSGRAWALGLALALGACGDDPARDAGDSALMTASATLGSSGPAVTDGGGGSEGEPTGTGGNSASAGVSTGPVEPPTTGVDGTTDASATTVDSPATDTGTVDTSTGAPAEEECAEELKAIGERTPYIWISNTVGGTVTKINTETAVIEGRYYTNAAKGYQPSRTTVNDLGDMLVGHRDSPGGVTKIAGHEARCADLNGNGTIDSSTGFDDVRPWGEDECVLWHQPTPGGAGPRALAWEPSSFNKDTCAYDNPNPRVWVAYRPAVGVGRVFRLDGATGEILDTVDADVGGAGLPYGGAVDAKGDFWFTARSGPYLFHVDAETLAVERFTTPNNPYGVAIDSFGNPFVADYHAGPGVDAVTRFNVDTKAFEQIVGGAGRYRGIQIDTKGVGWVAGNVPCRLVKVDTQTDTILDNAIPLPGCNDPVGVSIDEEGDVWVVDRGASLAYEIDAETHEVKNTLKNLIGPYTYSDMTGGSLRLVQGPKPG